MVCIYCGGDTRVINSRPQKRQNNIWRRRLCVDCNTVFTSIEAVDYSGSIVVRKKEALEPFSRDKLLVSLHGSLKHRENAHTDASALTDTVIARLHVQVSEATLSPDKIVLTTLDVLENFDKAAATHYKAFHSDQM